MPDDKRDIKQEIQQAAGLDKSQPVITNAPKPGAKLRLPKIAEISVWLDGYDDLFSDFDPRPHEERAVSEDFLREARTFSKEKAAGNFELILLIPHKLQNVEQETVIIKRLHEFFSSNHDQAHRAINANRRGGAGLAALSLVLLFCAAWLRSIQTDLWLVNFILVVLEPAGWFTIWTGMERLFFVPERLRSDLEFYGKMATCMISFIPY